jgi:hypothetical protein
MVSSIRSYMQYARPGHVTLKVLQCVLFVFFNRAQRVIRNKSVIVDGLDLRGTAMIPLLFSAALHIALMCPGLVIPTRRGRVPVISSLLNIMLLYALAGFLVTFALWRYMTTASFVSVLLASHLCLVVRPINSDLVPAQKFAYGYFMDISAYSIPVIAWILLPVLRVHELEAIALLFIPDALCFVFEYVIRVTNLLLNVGVIAGCALCGIGDTALTC